MCEPDSYCITAKTAIMKEAFDRLHVGHLDSLYYNYRYIAKQLFCHHLYAQIPYA